MQLVDMSVARLKLRLISFLLFALVFAPSHLGVVPAEGQTEPTLGIWSTTYSSNNITDPNVAPGGRLTVEVNATAVPSPGMSAFDLVIVYDPGFLKALGPPDVTSGTMFGETAFLVDPNPLRTDGEVRLAVAKLGPPAVQGSGILAHVTFEVKTRGANSLGLTDVRVTMYDSVTKDTFDLSPPPKTIGARFNDDDQGRQGPVASFTFSPILPIQGENVTFEANSSFDVDNSTQGADKGIRRWSWTWGDGQTVADLSFSRVGHIFGGTGSPRFGLFWVRLLVRDWAGFTAYDIQLVEVAEKSIHDAAIRGFGVSKTVAEPGQDVVVSLFVDNAGTFNETTISLDVTWDGGVLIQEQFALNRGGSREFSRTVSTSGLRIGPYEINAAVEVADDDVPENNRRRVIFIIQSPGGDPILLLLVGGGVVGTVGAVFALLRLRRRSSAD